MPTTNLQINIQDETIKEIATGLNITLEQVQAFKEQLKQRDLSIEANESKLVNESSEREEFNAEAIIKDMILKLKKDFNRCSDYGVRLELSKEISNLIERLVVVRNTPRTGVLDFSTFKKINLPVVAMGGTELIEDLNSEALDEMNENKKTPQDVQDRGELAKKKREPIIIFDAVKEYVGRDFYSKEGMDVAYSILKIFHENRIMVCDAIEILDFCKEALQFSTVNKFE